MQVDATGDEHQNHATVMSAGMATEPCRAATMTRYSFFLDDKILVEAEEFVWRKDEKTLEDEEHNSPRTEFIGS
jgi:hypothetical protein